MKMSAIINQTRPDHSIVRNSSFELLRIVAMFMIVAHHFSVHGGFDFPADSMTLNHLWQQFILMGGGLGNGIFVAISGYFLINSAGLNLRRLFNLWARIFFYSVAIYLLFLFVGHEAFSLKRFLKALMPITKAQWWFASAYFVMYLIHPYVNKLLHSFTREEYRKFLLAVFLYWSIIPALTKSDFGANATINFVCMYSLAGYVRLYPEDFRKRNYILYGLAFIGINFLSAIVINVVSKFSVFTMHGGYFFGMMRPFTVLAVLSLMLFFRGLNIPNSKIINAIASATFGVYLIHDNNLVRPFLWHDLFRNASFQDSPYLIPYSLAVIMAVYISCTVIELIRSRIFRALSHGKLS